MIPSSIINRDSSFHEIVDSFSDPNVSAMSYLILVVRGSGKTVLMRSIAKNYNQNSDWAVIDLNPQGDFITPFSEGLFLASQRFHISLGLSIDLKTPIITFHIHPESTPLSAEAGIRRILNELKKKGKRVLITIDEINQTQKLKYFTNFYQSLIGEELPVFLLMTGLIENVDSLIGDKSTSFLSRSPKIYLNPLDLASILKSYQKELSISAEKASDLARLSKGYAFACQVIGKLCFDQNNADITPMFLEKLDNYLAENGYGVIFNKMSEKEKEICLALAESNDLNVSTIRKQANMSEKNFNNYRLQMIRKGYLISKGYGKLEFALPRFKEYVLLIKNLL